MFTDKASAQRSEPPALRDTRVDTKVVLSGLWVATLLAFAYVDIFGFWRADVINGALDKEVPDSGFTINQTFLALTTLYVLVPILMVAVSLLATARLNRRLQLAVSVLYAASVVIGAVGESWTYYVLGSVVEFGLLAAIAVTAWRWPRSTQAGSIDPAPVTVRR